MAKRRTGTLIRNKTGYSAKVWVGTDRRTVNLETAHRGLARRRLGVLARATGDLAERVSAAMAVRWAVQEPEPDAPHVEGFIYFIQMGRFVKIGFSMDVDSRLAALQTGAPTRLKLLGVERGTVRDERSIHRMLKDAHSHGEWFHLTPEIRRAIIGCAT